MNIIYSEYNCLIIQVRILGANYIPGFSFLLQEMVWYYIHEVMTYLFPSRCLSILVPKW